MDTKVQPSAATETPATKSKIQLDIRKHAFYFILLGVLLFYVLLYFVLSPDARILRKSLSDMISGRDRITTRLSADKKLPNEAIIAYHRQRGKELQDILDSVRTKFEEKDALLEQWFEEIPKESFDPGTKSPPKEKFLAVYSTRRNDLIEKYATKTDGLKIARPIREFGLSTIEIDPEIEIKNKKNEIASIIPLKQEISGTPEQMKAAQKDFWLVQNMLEVFDTGKLKRISQYTFKNPAWPFNQPISSEIFFRKDIEIMGQMEFGDVNILLEEILNNKYFRTEIKKVSIKRDNSYKPENILIDVPAKKTRDEALKEFMKNNPNRLRFPLIDVTIQFSILDYQNNL